MGNIDHITGSRTSMEETFKNTHTKNLNSNLGLNQRSDPNVGLRHPGISLREDLNRYDQPHSYLKTEPNLNQNFDYRIELPKDSGRNAYADAMDSQLGHMNCPVGDCPLGLPSYNQEIYQRGHGMYLKKFDDPTVKVSRSKNPSRSHSPEYQDPNTLSRHSSKPYIQQVDYEIKIDRDGNLRASCNDEDIEREFKYEKDP